MSDITTDFVTSIKAASKEKTQSYDTRATVQRIEGNTVWVHIPGGVDETPVNKTISCSVGDTVQVRVSGGQAWIQGNATSPPTDDSRANEALDYANIARTSAQNAEMSAESAQESASTASMAAHRANELLDGMQEAAETAGTTLEDIFMNAANAQKSADDADDAAYGAILSLSEVQRVVGVLNWAAENAEYQLTQDRRAIPGKTYWTRTGTSPDYVYSPISYLDVVVYKLSEDTEVDSGKTYYELGDDGVYTPVEPVGTEDPSEEGWYEFNLDTYYEIITVDESIVDYVKSHLALTDDGLKIFRDDESGYLLLNEDGVELYDANRNPIATYGEGTVIGAPNGVHIELKSNPTMGFNDPIIGFYMGDSSTNMPVSYIDGSGLSIPHAVIVTSLQIGDETNGAWKWVVGDEQDPSAARHLKLIWIGA